MDLGRRHRDGPFTIQPGLMVQGFWLAVQIARYEARRLLPATGGIADRLKLVPLLAFFALVTARELLAHGAGHEDAVLESPATAPTNTQPG